MKELVFGAYGLVDNGKSSFIEAVTKQPTDTYSKEKQMGITMVNTQNYVDEIINGFTWRMHYIDNPGHVAYMDVSAATMSIIDIPLLVFSVKTGNLADFIAYIKIFYKLNYKQIVIVLTMLDLVPILKTEQIYESIKKLVEPLFNEVFFIPFIKHTTSHLSALNHVYLQLIKNNYAVVKPYYADIIRAYNVNLPLTPIPQLKGAILGGRFYTNQIESAILSARKLSLPISDFSVENTISTVETDLYFQYGLKNSVGNSCLHPVCETTSRLKYKTKLKNIKKEDILLILGSTILSGKIDNDKGEIILDAKLPLCLLCNYWIILRYIPGGYKISYILKET